MKINCKCFRILSFVLAGVLLMGHGVFANDIDEARQTMFKSNRLLSRCTCLNDSFFDAYMLLSITRIIEKMIVRKVENRSINKDNVDLFEREMVKIANVFGSTAYERTYKDRVECMTLLSRLLSKEPMTGSNIFLIMSKINDYTRWVKWDVNTVRSVLNGFMMCVENARSDDDMVGIIELYISLRNLIISAKCSDEYAGKVLSSFVDTVGRIPDDSSVVELLKYLEGLNNFDSVRMQFGDIYPSAKYMQEARDKWGVDISEYVGYIAQIYEKEKILPIVARRDNFDDNIFPVAIDYGDEVSRVSQYRAEEISGSVDSSNYTLREQVQGLLLNHLYDIVLSTINVIEAYSCSDSRCEFVKGMRVLEHHYNPYTVGDLLLCFEGVEVEKILDILKSLGYLIDANTGNILYPIDLVASAFRGAGEEDNLYAQSLIYDVFRALISYAAYDSGLARKGLSLVSAKGKNALHEIDTALMSYLRLPIEVDRGESMSFKLDRGLCRLVCIKIQLSLKGRPLWLC